MKLDELELVDPSDEEEDETEESDEAYLEASLDETVSLLQETEDLFSKLLLSPKVELPRGLRKQAETLYENIGELLNELVGDDDEKEERHAD